MQQSNDQVICKVRCLQYCADKCCCFLNELTRLCGTESASSVCTLVLLDFNCSSTGVVMPVCCRCNGSGRCRGCSCAKAGRQCTSCLPLRKGQCCNATVSTRDTNIIIEEDNQTIETGPIEESDSTLTSLIDAHQYIQEVTPILEDITITNGSNIPQLPTVNVVSCSTTRWGNLTGQEFSEAINSAYSQIASSLETKRFHGSIGE